MKNEFFIDLECNCNLHDELPYFAAGIIEDDYRENKKESISGKDYCVVFIDPWGDVCREWRGIDEIKIIEVSHSAFEMLKTNINMLEGAKNEKWFNL